MTVRSRKAGKPSTAAGERIYAVGDVHGCYDLLCELLQERIPEQASGQSPARSTKLVILGDLVDRGPDSAKVIEFLFKLQRRTSRVVVLMGNHEQVMLRAIDGSASMMRMWMRMGGDATLRSFGIEPLPFRDDIPKLIEVARQAIPAEWLAWIRALPIKMRSGSYFFCHAGVRPGVSLKRQDATDMLWIRSDFLKHGQPHEAFIVHGHNVTEEVDFGLGRIGVDTGAYRTGRLSALYLDGEQRAVITAKRAMRRDVSASPAPGTAEPDLVSV